MVPLISLKPVPPWTGGNTVARAPDHRQLLDQGLIERVPGASRRESGVGVQASHDRELLQAAADLRIRNDVAEEKVRFGTVAMGLSYLVIVAIAVMLIPR